MAIQQSILQGQGVGTQIGGVSAGVTQYVQEVVERQQIQDNGSGSSTPGLGRGKIEPGLDWEPLAWLLLGMI